MRHLDSLLSRFSAPLRRFFSTAFSHVSRWHRSEAGLGEAGFVIVSLLGTTTIIASAAFSDGGFSFEQLEAVLHDSANRVGGTLEVRGGVVATANGDRVDAIQVPVGFNGNGRPVPLTGDSADRLVLSYRDGAIFNPSVRYTGRQINGDGDELLEPGELFVLQPVMALH